MSALIDSNEAAALARVSRRAFYSWKERGLISVAGEKRREGGGSPLLLYRRDDVLAIAQQRAQQPKQAMRPVSTFVAESVERGQRQANRFFIVWDGARLSSAVSVPLPRGTVAVCEVCRRVDGGWVAVPVFTCPEHLSWVLPAVRCQIGGRVREVAS